MLEHAKQMPLIAYIEKFSVAKSYDNQKLRTVTKYIRCFTVSSLGCGDNDHHQGLTVA